MSPSTRLQKEWPVVRFAKREKAWKVDARTKTGGSRKFFATKTEAETFAAQCRVKRENEGVVAFKFDERQRVEYADCLDALAPFSATLREAVAHYVEHLKTREKSLSVREAVQQFLLAKTGDGASRRYLGDCRARLTRFATAFGNAPISSLTGADLDGWLRGLNGGVVTRNTFQRRLSALYEWARGLGYVKIFPLRGVRKPREPRPKAHSLSAAEAQRLLESARAETLPYWALTLFAGLRPESEMKRLTWDGINLDAEVVVVPEEDATGRTKTGSRAVPMSANLKAWLQPYAGRAGYVVPPNLRKLIDADKRRAGFGTPGSETPEELARGVKLKKWVADYTRHSYGNYLLAIMEDVGKVAFRMGNSPNIVTRNYLDKDPSRQAGKKKEAESFWAILPKPATTPKVTPDISSAPESSKTLPASVEPIDAQSRLRTALGREVKPTRRQAALSNGL